MAEKYVLNLMEDTDLRYGEGVLIGYWDGKSYSVGDVSFPGVLDNKHDERAKVYSSKKRAENAVKKLPEKFTYVTRAKIEKLD